MAVIGCSVCLFPWTARLPEDGGRPIPDFEGNLKFGCGKCVECINLRAKDWAERARHEISMCPQNCFITLTYDNDHLPGEIVLKDPFQRFMKRLRDRSGKKLSYMVSHEYGTERFRPHHHAIIFGYEPKEYKYLTSTKKGSQLFTSPEISDLWDEGFHSIGEANEKTAFYIASYSLKGKEHTFTNNQGEEIKVADSMDVSKRPGIGLRYFQKNFRELLSSDKFHIPRYYLKKSREWVDISIPEYKLELDLKNRVSITQRELLSWLVDNQTDLEKFLQLYEDRSQEAIRSKSDHERYAKLIISEKKKDLSESEFRTAPERDEFKHYKSALKHQTHKFKEIKNGN